MVEVNDIIQDILLRLPPKSLSRCKSLAKEWYHFISYNKSFRQRYLSRHKEFPHMVGFFSSKDYLYEGKHDQVHFLASSTQGRRKRRETTPSCPLDESLSFLGHDEIHVLATSNGFLLCCTRVQEYPRSYFICNPMNKLCLPLPTPKVQTSVLTHGFVCYSTSPRIDKVGYYKIVRAIKSDYTNPTIEILSSDFPEWKLVYLLCPRPFSFYARFPSTAIVERELVYFPGNVMQDEYICDKGIVIFDQRKNSVQLLLYPTAEDHHEDCGEFCSGNYHEYCFGKTDKAIRYARYEAGQIKVWTLYYNHIDNCGWEWSLKHTVHLEATLETFPEFYGNPLLTLPFIFIAFHPLNSNVIFIDRHQGKVLLFDLKNSKLEFNFSKSEEGWKLNHYVFPYTCGLIGPHLFLEG